MSCVAYKRHSSVSGINNHTIAIAGITEQGLRFAEMINNQPESGFQIAGFYHLDAETTHVELPRHYAHMGGTEAMKEAARTGEWDQIYLAPSSGQSISLPTSDQ